MFRRRKKMNACSKLLLAYGELKKKRKADEQSPSEMPLQFMKALPSLATPLSLESPFLPWPCTPRGPPTLPQRQGAAHFTHAATMQSRQLTWCTNCFEKTYACIACLDLLGSACSSKLIIPCCVWGGGALRVKTNQP